MTSRRQLLLGLTALSAAAALPRLSLADTGGSQRLVVVILRGGLDGLALLPPHGDPDYRAARKRAALPMPGERDGILDVDGTFGLHPALADLMPLWSAGELLGIHAVGLPGTARSHFEAQDMLEGGGAAPRSERTGWLSRALAHRSQPPGEAQAVAIGQGIPLILRGPATVTSLQPGGGLLTADPFLEQVAALYAADPQLAQALEQGMMTRQLLEDSTAGRARAGQKQQAKTTGQLLARDDGPRVAVLEVGGMDTHATQKSTLSTRLGRLAAATLGLKEGLGTAWSQTAVVMITEFGRTVSSNGTGGTDHGTGGAALLLGGAVAGGRIIADWPGLTDLYQDRDLKVTHDLRSVLQGVLRDHLGLHGRDIFPGAPGPLDGLIRPA